MSDSKVTLRCPECHDGTLVERVNKQNGGRFMGCTNWPIRRDDSGQLVGCDHTEPIPTYVVLMRQGAPRLPGMDNL